MNTSPSASNESTIYGYLENTLGFSPAGAAGALGNLEVESSFNPTAYNANEGAIGIAQWEGGRRAALQAYAAAHGGKETDLAIQLGYLGQELRNSFDSVLSYMRSAASPSSAATEWDANFERSAGTTRSERIGNAQTISQQITMGQLTATASPADGFASSKNTPPYPVGSLKPPLSAAQRAAVLKYTKDTFARANDPTVAGVDFGSLSDSELLAYYAIAVSKNSGVASPGQILGDLFSWVPALVYKAGFAIGGLALIVVGANAAAKKG